MRLLSACLMICLCCTMSVTAPAHGADPLASLKKFSDFQNIDVKQLMRGEIIGQRGQLMDFPNGITAQTCFFVPAPPEETASRLQTWDPTRCESMKVHISCRLKSPCGPADFKDVDLSQKQHPIKLLLEKTQAVTAGKSDLNMTHAEAREMSGCVARSAGPHTIGACWSSLLQQRASSFQQKGVAGVLPYETGGEIVSPVAMIRAMLQERPRISHEFAPLLQKAGLQKAGREAPSITPYHYWTFFDADHHATLSLGAVYQSAADGSYQLLDFQYYVSGNYYTAATLYSIWPVRAGNTTGSLVWRGDFFAAPVLRFTKGIERIAYGALMIQEIKKEIRCFQNDIRTKP